MLTLTYAKTQLDYDRLYIDFKIFLQHLKRKGFEFPYLAVTEHQTKRGKKEGNAGSLHLHVLIFSDTYIPFDTLKRAWSAKGSVHVQKIERAKNKGAYVAKYITKEGAPPDKKSYRTSRNIKRPTFKAGLGGEIESVEALGFEWKHLNHSHFTTFFQFCLLLCAHKKTPPLVFGGALFERKVGQVKTAIGNSTCPLEF